MGPGLAAIPERLLLAHARGEVLFIAGAGISQPARKIKGVASCLLIKLDTRSASNFAI